jgi:riboflavin synthase
MFTGLVAERGRLSADPAASPAGGGVRLRIAHSAALGERLAPGSSLAVAGVCLTVVERDGDESAAELSPETLARTTLGGLRRASEVNLEAALRAGDPLGGHWVQGHVDTVLRVLDRRDRGDYSVLRFELPDAYRAYVVEKGSVAVDGVSLTVAALAAESFETALVPHTLAVTTLGRARPGDRVNFEADILAKYVAQALAARGALAR